MQNTTNLNLKKPDYTDFADIQDINDNMDALDAALHDTQNSVATFTSSDVSDGSATAWTSVAKVNSGETHKSIFAKMSQMFKNIRYLYKMLGTTDISSIGDGTVTKALSVLNANKQNTLITESINGTTDTYGMINSGLDITATQILGATVSNQAGYAVLPLRKNGYWYFVIMAVSATSGHPVIAVPQGTQFSVWYIKTK